MFNALLSLHQLFLLTLLSFCILLTIRLCFIWRKVSILLYYICFVIYVFIVGVGGGGVQNDGYARMEEFILLEKNHQLEEAKKNPQNYDGMLQFDLQQANDAMVDKAEAISIGWLFALIAEISIAISVLFRGYLEK